MRPTEGTHSTNHQSLSRAGAARSEMCFAAKNSPFDESRILMLEAIEIHNRQRAREHQVEPNSRASLFRH